MVYAIKYGRFVLSPKVNRILKKTFLDIENRYEIRFLEVRSEKDHIHFLLKCIPTYSLIKIALTLKSITSSEIFLQAPFGEMGFMYIPFEGIGMKKQ